MKPGIFFAAIVATFVVGFAVGRVSAPGEASSAVPSPAVAAPSGTLPPMMNAPVDTPPTGGLSGTVAEVIQVPNYTYLRLRTAAGDEWAAVASTQDVREGQAVRVVSATPMTSFTSKTLGRTFDSIWFGQLEGGGGQAPAGSAAGLPPGHPAVAEGPSGAAGAVAAVEQAGGALSLRVADVFAEKDVLGGKRVRLQGVAAKVTSVQGRYYVHVKDGSGAPGKDDDLIVITGSEVKADQRVILEGRVALNKDVGMGAPYPVVVENATVVGN